MMDSFLFRGRNRGCVTSIKVQRCVRKRTYDICKLFNLRTSQFERISRVNHQCKDFSECLSCCPSSRRFLRPLVWKRPLQHITKAAHRHFVCACARWMEYFEFGGFSNGWSTLWQRSCQERWKMTSLRDISKTSASVSSGFQTRETWGLVVLIVYERLFGNLMKHEARVLEITSPTEKISLNYYLNKFSQFNYYIWDVKYAWTSKTCVWCAWSYHLIAALWQLWNILQLRSRYLAVCQFRANTLLRKANGRVQI